MMVLLTKEVIRCINERLPLSEDMLFICWKFAVFSNKNPLDSDLWKVLSTRLEEVLKLPLHPLNWAWFKSNIMKSAVAYPPLLSSVEYIFARTDLVRAFGKR